MDPDEILLAEPGTSAIEAWDALLTEESPLQRPPLVEPSCPPSP